MIPDNEAEARSFTQKFVDDATLERLDAFAHHLAAENTQQNLVAAGSLDHVWQRHFADSLQLLEYVPRGTGIWLDLGTGAGFPGLLIACAQRDREVVLVESRKRRVEWLERSAGMLQLSNVRVIGSRLESAASFPAAVISARAFAPLDRLLALSGRFSTADTVWLLPKGRSAGQELLQQGSAIQRMFHVEQSHTDPEAGILVGRGVPSGL